MQEILIHLEYCVCLLNNRLVFSVSSLQNVYVHTFPMSSLMQVACSCGWCGSLTSDVSKSSALQHTGNA